MLCLLVYGYHPPWYMYIQTIHNTRSLIYTRVFKTVRLSKKVTCSIVAEDITSAKAITYVFGGGYMYEDHLTNGTCCPKCLFFESLKNPQMLFTHKQIMEKSQCVDQYFWDRLPFEISVLQLKWQNDYSNLRCFAK